MNKQKLILLISLIFLTTSCQNNTTTKPIIQNEVKKPHLSNQVDLNEKLLLSVKNKKLDEAENLIQQGADINYQENVDGFSVLHYAVLSGYLKGIKWILSKKPNLNLKNKEGMTAFHFACREGNLEVVKEMIEQSVDLSIKENKHGWNCLDFAVFWGQLDIVLLLIDHKVSINELDFEGSTALHKSVLKSDLKITKILLEKGASPNIKTKNSATPLSLSKNDEMRRLLKQYGAKD